VPISKSPEVSAAGLFSFTGAEEKSSNKRAALPALIGMTSLAGVRWKWPLIRQSRDRADGTGLEAMSDKSRALHARIAGAQVARSICPSRAVTVCAMLSTAWARKESSASMVWKTFSNAACSFCTLTLALAASSWMSALCWRSSSDVDSMRLLVVVFSAWTWSSTSFWLAIAWATMTAVRSAEMVVVVARSTPLMSSMLFLRTISSASRSVPRRALAASGSARAERSGFGREIGVRRCGAAHDHHRRDSEQSNGASNHVASSGGIFLAASDSGNFLRNRSNATRDFDGLPSFLCERPSFKSASGTLADAGSEPASRRAAPPRMDRIESQIR